MPGKGGGTTTDQYPSLTFAPGVNWQHVNPQLWIGVNAVLTQLAKKGVVISGYRTSAQSIAVGGFANDPHTKGIAADILVGGLPIGTVPGIIPLLAAQGIESGNQPGFFNGAPDPGHVQLAGAGTATSAPTSSGTSTNLSGLDNISASGCSTFIFVSLLTFGLGLLEWKYG